MRKLLIIILLLMSILVVHGQHKMTVKGIVIENSHTPVIAAGVFLMYGKDTLRTVTDTAGKFSFRSVESSKFSIKVRSLGYVIYQKSYELPEDLNIQLDPVILEEETLLLKNVTIKRDYIPVRYNGDTVEYDAASYKTREEDRVEQLLKQLPGVVVDKDGNVTSMGKKLTKIRVNGKDFFTGDVKEFIKKLPADLVSKIQIINDYGDIANFTGDKSGTSNKILNLVTKNKINSGKFGGGLAEAGTNKKLGIEGSANFWKDEKQISGSAKLKTQDNGAGSDNSSNGELNYNNRLSHTARVGSNYKYTGTSTNSKTISNAETVIGSQILNNQNTNENSSSKLDNSFMGVLSNISKKDVLRLSLSGNLTNNKSSGSSESVQTGASRQDLNSLTSTNGHNQDIHLSTNYVRKLKEGKNISLYIDAGHNNGNSADNIFDQIKYYNELTGNLEKDSLLNRLLDQSNRSNKLMSAISFTNPIGSRSNSTNKKQFTFGYSFFVNNIASQLATFVQGIDRNVLVDSLSNAYNTSYITHSLGFYYGVNAKKWRYGFSLTPQLSVLNGKYGTINENITRNYFSLVPRANLDFNGENESFTMLLNQITTAPAFDQLQPVPDLRNLQRIVIGNPNLKAQSKQSLSMEYHGSSKKYKADYSFQFMGNLAENDVVTNTLLRTDTLNSLQQEVHYVNANGNLDVTFNFFVSKSFHNNTYRVSLTNNITYANNVFFSENVKGMNKVITLSPSLLFQMDKKWTSSSTQVQYTFTTNNYTLGVGNQSNIKGWNLTTSGHIVVTKSLNLNYDINKSINKGYVIDNSNPLLISLGLEKFLFKKKSSIKLSTFDLLNEGNNQQRTFSANTTTDIRSNQVTRYFSLSFISNVDKFFSTGF